MNISTTTGLGIISAVCIATPAIGQTITLDHFDYGVAGDTLQISLAASGDGVNVGSYSVRIDRQPLGGPEVLPGFWQHPQNHYSYLRSLDQVHSPGPNLLDNGKLDRDPAVGRVRFEIDLTGWPNGRYALRAGAHNRPAPGAYVNASQPIEFVLGDSAEGEVAVDNLGNADHHVIYKREGIYACFPQVVFHPDGGLIVTFGTRVRASHIDSTGGTATLYSQDGGRTWAETDRPFVNRLWQIEDNQLVTASSDGWINAPASERASLESQGKRIRHVRDGVIAYLGGASALTSTDGGRTWMSKPIPIPDDFSGTMVYHKAAAEVVTDDGVRLVAIYGRRLPRPDGSWPRSEVLILRSTDDGATWTCRPMYPDGLHDPEQGFDETALQELSDGRIIAMMRGNPAGFLFQAFSDDGGVTWSNPEKTSMFGFPAQVLVLDDGRLLCVYGYRRHPMGVRASISDNNAKSWDATPEMVIRADAEGDPSDVGYPISVQLSSGEVFTVYYITTSAGITHIAGTHWRVPE